MRRDPEKKVTITSPVFNDRVDAGRRLAERLIQYRGPDTVVCALANGGVVVGSEVAEMLQAPMELVVCGAIMHPFSPSFAVCAITEHGERVCDEVGVCALDASWIDHEAEHQAREIVRRRMLFGLETPANLSNKTVVLVDDGMVTGLPMKAAILTVRRQNPARIIVAVPSAPSEITERILPLVDEVIVLIQDKQYRGVTKAYYTHFPVVHDTDVKMLLERTSHQLTDTRKI